MVVCPKNKQQAQTNRYYTVCVVKDNKTVPNDTYT